MHRKWRLLLFIVAVILVYSYSEVQDSGFKAKFYKAQFAGRVDKIKDAGRGLYYINLIGEDSVIGLNKGDYHDYLNLKIGDSLVKRKNSFTLRVYKKSIPSTSSLEEFVYGQY